MYTLAEKIARADLTVDQIDSLAPNGVTNRTYQSDMDRVTYTFNDESRLAISEETNIYFVYLPDSQTELYYKGDIM